MPGTAGLIDITGRTYGSLVVLRRCTVPRRNRQAFWVCQCSLCNGMETAGGCELRKGKVRECWNCRQKMRAARRKRKAIASPACTRCPCHCPGAV